MTSWFVSPSFVLVITASIHFDIDEFAKLMVGFRSEGVVVAGGREAAAKEDDLDGTHLLLLLLYIFDNTHVNGSRMV